MCLPIIMRNYISPVLLILPRIPHIIGTFNILTTLRISCFFPTEGGQRGDIRESHKHPTGITGMLHHQNYEITACHVGLEIRLMFWSDIARTQYKIRLYGVAWGI